MVFPHKNWGPGFWELDGFTQILHLSYEIGLVTQSKRRSLLDVFRNIFAVFIVEVNGPIP